MRRGYMDTGAWHEHIERQCRGRDRYDRDRLHHAVKICFAHLEYRWAAKGYQAYDLLLTYEAFLALRPLCHRGEEVMFDDIIAEFRSVMAERLNNQIPPEMHPNFVDPDEGSSYSRTPLFI